MAPSMAPSSLPSQSSVMQRQRLSQPSSQRITTESSMARLPSVRPNRVCSHKSSTEKSITHSQNSVMLMLSQPSSQRTTTESSTARLPSVRPRPKLSLQSNQITTAVHSMVTLKA
jgi:hypothetical protein